MDPSNPLILGTHYWAIFEKRNGVLFRWDTRVYLQPMTAPSPQDPCLGAIIGKNPGSAQPTRDGEGLQPIALGLDRCLLTVRSVVMKAYGSLGSSPPECGFIQVLNLFYLCDPQLKRAIGLLQTQFNSEITPCLSESRSFPWVWAIWGGPSRDLDPYKKRFVNLKSKCHFFVDKHTSHVTPGLASTDDFAKHTQGLRHDLVVPHLKGILICRSRT